MAPPESWSQIIEQTPSTTAAGMPGYVVPPLGLTPPDFSSWSLPPPEVPLSWRLPAASQGLPGIGRSNMIRGTVERHDRVQRVPGPWAPAQGAQALPMSVPLTPQVAPPLHQPPPSWAATPYQQAVHPPGKSTGREVTFNSPSDKAGPAGGQTTKDHRRQKTRGWGDGG